MNKIFNIFKNNKKILLISSICLVLIGILTIFLTNTFSLLTEMPMIVIESENKSFNNDEPGSWKVEKSATWVNNDEVSVTLRFDSIPIIDEEDSKKNYVIVVDSSLSNNNLPSYLKNLIGVIGSNWKYNPLSSQEMMSMFSESKKINDENNNTFVNPIALISFADQATLLSDFSTDKNTLIGAVDRMSFGGNSNYYAGLKAVEDLLSKHDMAEGENCVVIFITGNYPTKDTPSEVGEYIFLKDKYSKMEIDAVQIQNDLGSTIIEPLKKMSDNQYAINIPTLIKKSQLLLQIDGNMQYYFLKSNYIDEVIIEDYINTEHFKIDNFIYYAEYGDVTLNDDKITWTMKKVPAGQSINLNFMIKLKDEYLNINNVYKTNLKEVVKVKLDEIEEVTSPYSPLIKNFFSIKYDANAPEGCNPDNVPENSLGHPFELIKISEVTLKCPGYQFKGWMPTIYSNGYNSNDVRKVGSEYAELSNNVIFKGTWAKLSIKKSAEGTVYEKYDNYLAKADGDKVFGSNKITKDKVEAIEFIGTTNIPSGIDENNIWDASEQQNGSIIALYKDSDNNGLYELYICQNEGVVANPDSSYLFANYFNLKKLLITNLDISKVTNMSHMFENDSQLSIINAENYPEGEDIVTYDYVAGKQWDTSNITESSDMFKGCTRLRNYDSTKVDISMAKDTSLGGYIEFVFWTQ